MDNLFYRKTLGVISMRGEPCILLNEQRHIVAYLDGLPPSLCFGDLRQTKVNALPAHALGQLQVKGGAPKGVLREGVAPFRWADVDIMPEGYIVPERSEWVPSMLRPSEGVFKGEL